MDIVNLLLFYTSLGYDVYFTNLFGKDAITMTKRHSYKHNRKIHCQQIFSHIEINIVRLRDCLTFMYNNIQQQEESGKFYEIIN